MEVHSHTAKPNDKQNKILLMLKGSKESWRRAPNHFLCYHTQSGCRNRDVSWGRFKDILGVVFFFCFFLTVQKCWRRRLQNSEETLKRTLESLSFWRTYWTLPATVLPHTQSAKRLDVPHCAVSHSHICHQLDDCWKEGCHLVQRQESKTMWITDIGYVGLQAKKLCATAHMIHLDVSVWRGGPRTHICSYCNQSCGLVLIFAGENESP